MDSLRQAYLAAREAYLPVKLVREADGLLWQPAHFADLGRGTAASGTQYGRTSIDPLALAAGELEPTALGAGLPSDGALYLVPSVKQLTAPTWRQLRELAHGGLPCVAPTLWGFTETSAAPGGRISTRPSA